MASSTYLDDAQSSKSCSPRPRPNRKPTTIDLIGGIFCNICTHTFSNKTKYDQHYKLHNSGSPQIEYACVVCHLAVAHYRSFLVHCYRRHVHKDKFSSTSHRPTIIDLIGGILCHICKLTFSNKKEYNEHYATHDTGGTGIQYECVVCHKVLTGFVSFRNHCADCHVQRDKFKCKFCDKTFRKQFFLYKHTMAVHNMQKNKDNSTKRLPLTNLGQADANDLTALKPPKTRKPTTIDLVGGIFCHVCQLTFSNKTEYDKHYATHNAGSAEIEYACIICHKVIADYRTFRGHCYDRHLKKDRLSAQRSKAKPTIDLIGGIFCKVCQLTFSNKMEYDEHYATHNTGGAEIKYACVACRKEVAGYTSFRRHCYDQHIQIAKFECKYCDETFMKQWYLDKHIMRRHAFKCPEENCTDTLPHKHLEQLEAIDSSAPEPPKTRKPTAIDLVGGIFCLICQLTFGNKKEYDRHYAAHDTGGAEIEYACVVCRKSLAGYTSFRTHCYNQHVQKDKFKCKHCEKSFIRQSTLNEHITAVHIYKCTKGSCTKQFTTEKELHVHEFIHKKERNKPPYQCHTCYEQIDGIDSCEEHVDQHCTFSYTCPICNESLTKSNATSHLTKHFGDGFNEMDSADCESPEISEDSSINVIGGIFCCYCENIYKNRVEYDVHFTAEHEDNAKVYCCIICKKKFETYSKFGCHCYDHISKARFECDECDQSFPRLSLLVRHTEAFHAGGAARLACARCPRKYRSIKRLVAHARAQHEQRAHACTAPGCGITFETPKDLILHQKQHKATLDTWCRQCGLQFTTPVSCEKHLEVHKEKLFSCPVCKRQYGEKYLMMNHISQHFESVLHMCKVCGKIYDAKRRLIEHVKTHSSAKNYECEYCGKGFVKTNHLQQHLSIHTGMKPFKCLACPKTFGSYPNWHKHMRKMHNIDTKMLKKSANNSPSDSVNSPFTMIHPDSVTSQSTGTPMSAVEQDYDMADTDDSTMDSGSIDNIVIEKESPIFDIDMNPVDMVAALASDLPDNIVAFVTEAQEAMLDVPPPPPPPAARPAAPAPEFSDDEDLDLGIGELIDLDDHLIPDIDPLITSPAYTQHLNFNYYESYDQGIIERSKWEPPVITKFYENFYGEIPDMGSKRLPVMNTNIF